MIKAEFFRSEGAFTGFSVSGHSGYSDIGSDIVCASVSSAVMLTCNAATESFGLPAKVSAEGERVSCKIGRSTEGEKLVGALYQHLKVLEETYPENISVKISEV